MIKNLLKLYRCIYWIGDAPGQRADIMAKSADEAKLRLRTEYGHDITVSIHNDEDAERPRES